jgi:non-ribosomal peptide synthetase component F
VLADLEKTTYSMLEFNANRLARHLRSRGVKRGSRVAVLLPCSTDAYAAILAILKAGAAYVPLDVEYPRDRISYILNESGAEVLLTTSDRTRQFSGFRGTVIHLDSDRIEIDAESSLRLAPAEVGASPRDLCYIMYKSGSMGPPNGVMVQHRQASHLVYAEGETFHFRPEDCVHQGASLSFDNSIEEMWLAFESGALLISPNLQVAHTGPDLSR